MVQKMAKTRIQVPVSEDTLLAYQALADVQRSSLAAVTAEILEQAAPMVRQIAGALETAKTAPARALRGMTDALDQVLMDADQLRMDIDPKPQAKPRGRKKKTG